MTILAAIIGILLIIAILWEGFESFILPRRVTRRFRLIRYLAWPGWSSWKAIGQIMARFDRKESWLSFYGPLSLLVIMSAWAAGLIVGFALLYWATGPAIHMPTGRASFPIDIYLSASSFFTVGIPEVVPVTGLTRFLTLIESALGFGFLAIIISYLPPLNQSFGRREVSISLLDARAGSPPTAGEMLRRHSYEHGLESLRELLREWERWSAEILESHQSYPVLAYFRSQHDNQSWLSALTAVLDTCSLIMAGLEGACERQAELTYAMARHTVVDLCLVFRQPPHSLPQDRLPAEQLVQLRAWLGTAGLKLRDGAMVDQRLTELRQMYEPYIYSLAKMFDFDVPPWLPVETKLDDWQVSEWEERRTPLHRNNQRKAS